MLKNIIYGVYLAIISTMRLLYFTNRDLASNVMLNHLLPLLHPYIQHIFISDKVGKANPDAPQALQDLKFFEQILPNEFLFPQLDAQAKTHKPEYQTFEALSQQYAVPITSLNDIKSEESLNLIRSLQPDLVLSIRYGRIFGDAFVQIPRLGVVNFHSGRLPNYRGVLAVFRALKNGDKAIHGTLHYIDDKTIDTGGVIGFSHLPVEPDRSLLWHILHLYPASAAFVADQVVSILQGEKPEILAQNEAESAYYSFPSAEEIADFEAAGWKVVDATEYAAFIQHYL